MALFHVRYRVVVPLALTGVALIAGIAVALTTFLLIGRHVESNAEAETRRLASTLARALAQPVLRNDVWQAYQLVRAATEAGQREGVSDQVQIVVLDAAEQVFVSPTPRNYPIGMHLSVLPPSMIQAARQVSASTPPGVARVAAAGQESMILGAPIVSEEDELLGVLLATHPAGISQLQRQAVIRQLALLGLVAVVLVSLAGGALGVRLTAPLERLREVMQNTPRRPPLRQLTTSSGLGNMTHRRDEVGDLARTFSAMLGQIAASQELERHMLEAERLASIGQLSAGIAHEVNNPLGGMLATIQNRRLRGGLDESTERTLAMLERGLHQIHETIQALLNEARREQRPLQAADLHDLALLLQPEAEHLRCRLGWQLVAPTGADLPAVAVRQVVLNLSLNALAAAGQRGAVKVWSASTSEHWQVFVGNSGPALDEERLRSLTQGTQRSADGRLGLGLWITARILHTLGGHLALSDSPEPDLGTVLVARFPLAEPASTDRDSPDANDMDNPTDAH